MLRRVASIVVLCPFIKTRLLRLRVELSDRINNGLIMLEASIMVLLGLTPKIFSPRAVVTLMPPTGAIC